MNNARVVQALTELANQESRMSLARRLASIYDAIEHAISTGTSHEQVVQLLRANGFENLSLTTFRTNLGRIRKKSANRAPAKQEGPSESKRARNTAEFKPAPQQPTVKMDVSRPTERRGADTKSGGGNILGYDPHAGLEGRW